MTGESGARDPLAPGAPGDVGRAGLCPTCKHVKRIVSGRGSTFLLCRRAKTDQAFRKYPPQPVRQCPGYES